jgi:hypothetical protein
MRRALAAAVLGLLMLLRVPAASGPSPAPAPSPSVLPEPQPTPQPTPAYRYIYRPTPAGGDPPMSGPAILEIDLTDQVLVTPTDLNVRVVTTASVVSVTVQTLGRSLALPEVSPGLFGFSTTLRAVPASLRNRTFDVQFIAADPQGRSASVTLPLSLK